MASMKAMVVEKPAPIESDPLHAIDAAVPEPGPGEILVRVRTCGVCRTDLHVAEGDLPPRHPRIIPGHEVVGVVDKRGVGAARFKQGDRVGVAWLRETCGVCVYCRRGRENLCPNARFTGYDHDGGYCEWAVVREDFAYAIPDSLGDEEAAPLLCAGIIGFRAIKRAEVRPGATVGLYGFGGSAHLAIQVLRHWGCRVFVMSRADRIAIWRKTLAPNGSATRRIRRPRRWMRQFCLLRREIWCCRLWKRSIAEGFWRSREFI